MAGYIRHLGAISAQQHTRLENLRLEAEDLALQVQTSLLVMLETSLDQEAVQGYKARLDQLQLRLSALKVQLSTMVEDAEIPAWKADLVATREQIKALWAEVETARKAGQSRLEFRGLYWGIGAAGLALALGYVVYRAAKKKRR